jgi:aspartate kinase
MARIVMKFGGTSVADIGRIHNVARHVKREVDAGHQVAVVVSAMSGKTNELVGWVQDAPKTAGSNLQIFDAREYDAVVASGEQVTSGLLAIALQSMGVHARSWQGWQIPIKTDGAHGAARIKDIDGSFLVKRFEEGQVAVVAGFQGIAPDNRISTLGRGGSDTSAVAIAAAVKADRCDIYTDVDGVYTTDPRIEPKARRLDKISFEEMLEMASLGSKVLQVRSVELAMVHKVRTFVRPPSKTRCARHGRSRKPARNSYLRRGRNRGTVSRYRHRLRQGRGPDLAAPRGRPAGRRRRYLRTAGRSQYQCRHDRPEHFGRRKVDRHDLHRTVRRRSEGAARSGKSAETVGFDNVQHDEGMSKVSVIGIGMRSHAGVAATAFKALADRSINIRAITTSEIKISILIDGPYTELAVRTLHSVYGLDKH